MNVVENGRCLCLYCETEYHLTNIFSPATIGMTEENNILTIIGRLNQLPLIQRNELIAKYPNECAYAFANTKDGNDKLEKLKKRKRL